MKKISADWIEIPEVSITTSKAAVNVLRPIFTEIMEEREAFVVLCLNRAGITKAAYLVGIGGVTGVVSDPKIIYRAALQPKGINSIIICHNHPSGNTTPSTADDNMTTKLVAAGKFLEMPVLDHIILTENAYYSYADEGRLL